VQQSLPGLFKRMLAVNASERISIGEAALLSWLD
jgi:hypothetical protein